MAPRNRLRAAVEAGVRSLSDLEARWAGHLGERRTREFHAAQLDICIPFGREHIR
jgi:hypothetical protein